MLNLQEQCVILEMEATGKTEALRELALAAHRQCREIEVDRLVEILQEREHLGSTGVGDGVAIPHGKVPGLNELLLCFGRSREGISFDAIDNRPVHLFVLILFPAGMAAKYLQTLARVSRLLKNVRQRHQLLETPSVAEILSIFHQFETSA